MSYEVFPEGIPLQLGFMSNDILPQSVFAIWANGSVPTQGWSDTTTGSEYTLEKHATGDRIRYFLEATTARGSEYYLYDTVSPDVQACDKNGVIMYDIASPELLERRVLGILSHYNLERPAETLQTPTDRKFADLIGQVILDDHTREMISQLVTAAPGDRANMLDIIHESVAQRAPDADPRLLRRSVRTAILSAAKNRK